MAPDAAADVISVRGVGEVRDARDWTPAKNDQDLFTGNLVRTQEYSGMGLLFRDLTQIRLSEKTTLEVKDVGNRSASGTTTLSLSQGRAWTKSKRTGGALTMQTPAATAAIRGTDWDLEVLEDGTATITVLSGTVEFFNDFGAVTVNSNEQARARIGQAPVKLTVVNPRDRVQWVSAYVAAPRRWIGQAGTVDPRLARIADRIEEQAYASAIAELRRLAASDISAQLMLADLYMALGDVEQAIDTAEAAVVGRPDNATAKALLARLYLITDKVEMAQNQIDAALAQEPANQEALLVQGQIARLGGNEGVARGAYSTAIEGEPTDPRGWHGLGIIEAEREDVVPAREALLKAIELDAKERGFQGELGTLETFSDNFKAARQAFDAALKRNPDDYVALTGQGLMKLKRGKTQEALDDFLKAGLMEPRYARAHVYAAVAYYQLGFIRQALDTMATASQVDPRDPLPHLLTAMIQTDLFQPGDAVTSARQAQRLMPYLKSLNQIANNQRGTANLGRAYEFFGLSEWANTAAQESYYPYWAGSHLFLADRYVGLFNKNSELYQGFLSDPTVFGASNRYQTLFEKPGLHFRAGNRIGNNETLFGRAPFAEMRGFSNAVTPAAFFVQRGIQETSNPASKNDNELLTVALGVRPTHAFGLFGFANTSVNKVQFTEVGDFTGTDRREVTRVDVGANFKASPTSQFWLKGAKTESDDDVIATVGSAPDQDFIAVDNNFHLDEIGLRHTFDFGEKHEISWGVEWARKETNAAFVNADVNGSLSFIDLIVLDYDYQEEYKSAFVSHRYQITPRLLVQTDLHLQDFDRFATYIGTIQPLFFAPILVDDSSEDLSIARVSPRIGIVYKFDENRLVRLVYQNWIRPPSFATLSPVATAGIPLEDRMVEAGGELHRLRGQIEWEVSPKTFLKGFVDHKKIDNNKFSQEVFTLSDQTELKTLRERDFASITAEEFTEWIDYPDFEKGSATVFGVGVNHILSDEISLFGRYRYARSENTGITYNGNDLPYMPSHKIAVGGTWVLPHKFYLVGRLNYRTERFADAANTVRLDASPDASLDIFWESPEKHILLRGGIDDLFDRNDDAFYSAEMIIKF
ncbi:MAG: TonB-dependent receptor domain-containing protein [Magnetospiraceae bacterium]